MSMTFDWLPTEIWCTIVEFLSTDDQKAISLVCTAFRSIARRCLFQHLSLTVDLSLDDIWEAASDQKKIPPKLQDLFFRLEFFYTSADISLDLQSCILNCKPADIPSRGTLYHIFFRYLPQFRNLKELKICGTRLEGQFVSSIAKLPALQCLSLIDCTAATNATDPQDRIITKELVLSFRDSQGSQSQWLSIIDFPNLTSLRLTSSHASIGILAQIAATDQDLPALSHIHVNGEESVMKSASLAMSLASKCLRNVTGLHILPSTGSGILFLPPVDGLSLTAYEGPHYFLRSILKSQRNLRSVRLFGVRWGGTCDLVDIHQDLRDLHLYATLLELLQIQIFPTQSVCQDIAKFFPKLVSLTFLLPLNTHAVVDPMFALAHESFFEAVSQNLALPSELQILNISMIHCEMEDGPFVIDYLSKTFDSLQHIHLHFPRDCWLSWQRVSSPGPQSDIRAYGGFISSGQLDAHCPWFEF